MEGAAMQAPGGVSMCTHDNKPVFMLLRSWRTQHTVIQAVTLFTPRDDVDTIIGSIAKSPPKSFSVVQRSGSPLSPSASALSSAQVVVKEISISQEATIES